MNLGLPEMIFIFLLALIIFGPKKLPEIGRQIGKAMNEFKRASNEFKSQIEGEIRNLELEEAVKAQPAPQILPPEHTYPVSPNVAQMTENPHPVSPDPGETRVGHPGDHAEPAAAPTADAAASEGAANPAAAPVSDQSHQAKAADV